MNKGTVLVTGAAGFTGQHACKRLAEKGYRVAAIVRSHSSLKKLPLIDHVDYHVCDLKGQADICELVQRVSPHYVLHLAGKNSVPESWANPILYMESNILGTIHLLNALRQRERIPILIAGSRLKFDLSFPVEPTHPYGLSKSIQEVISLAWGELFHQHVILAEPCNLVGPGPSTGICSLLAGYIAALERGEPRPRFRLSSASATRDFLDVRDAVDAYELLLRRGSSGTVYPVCSGVERRLGDVCQSFINLAETECPLEENVNEEAAEGMPERAALIQPELLNRMGWSPAIPWGTSVSDILQYYRREETDDL
ncbi:NAD-dependent epimerase/dehydratase family protein [Paenibacillus woosongensis]|uniref:NAD-dependent epimerase/dehydratase family protein n=1 Tax=Paenibacillus woosongensis TaxID=307580 RepID=A0A7X2YY61_9BACL|nr:NAD-dependent epimerase/dehydratase family protein [Paenibacillus woosongensis]MUG44091.1 NAD-dependent epimerase/dehydratase family protein [Paenibacillus woosongensis]